MTNRAPVRAFAAAKLNLYLHVLARRADGLHELDSLVAFADLGDEVWAAPAGELTLRLEGPFADPLAAAGPAADNLVLRAARRLAAAAGRAPQAEMRLLKRLPVAAGIGGGSADAAAALRALLALWAVPEPPDLHRIAAALGADVPVCLGGVPAYLGGAGERLEPMPELPSLPAVLANPGLPLPTARVFGAFAGPYGGVGRFAPPRSAAELIESLRRCGNDLQATATALLPAIGDVLAALAGEPGARLARMSGSGPTCFALFDDSAAAQRAADRLAAAHRHWWVRAVRIGPGESRLPT